MPDAVIAKLAATCDRLRLNAGGLRWSSAESWHITLQFLGNATAEQLACLAARLAEVRAAPLPVRLGGLGVFDRAGVFFAEVEVTPELAALQKRVIAATAQCGFQTEDRPYHPHITLARAKGDGGKRQLRGLKASAQGPPAFPPFLAHEFLLYESHLGAGGSKYEVRARFSMGADQQVSKPANQPARAEG